MGKFCVIGKTAKSIDRTWFYLEEDAVTHAKRLVVDGYTVSRTPQQLFVVEAKMVVECGMPEVTVRTFLPGDAPEPTHSIAPGAELEEAEVPEAISKRGYAKGRT
jgi:hypothetical protein